MRNSIYKHTKHITVAIVIILAIVLFNVHININSIILNTQTAINNYVYRNNNNSDISLSDALYYNDNLLVANNKNNVNKINKINFDIDVVSNMSVEDLDYKIVFDNSNGNSTYTEDESHKTIELKEAKKIDTTMLQTTDNPGIKQNSKYGIKYENNKITIYDQGLTEYVGGNIDEPKKWVGFLVDFGVKVQGTTYNISPEDYSDAARWGATNDTTFVMWLTTEKGGTYTFTNVNNEEDTYDLIVEFSNDTRINLESASVIDITNVSEYDNPGIAQNADKYTVSYDENKIIVTNNGLIPYVGGNISEPKKWVGILVDLGVKVQGTNYNISSEDYSDAARWGATNDTTFVMWLTTEKSGMYTFINVEDSTDTYDLYVDFRIDNGIELSNARKLNVSSIDNEDIIYNTSKYSINSCNNKIVISDNGLKAYKDRNVNEPKKWVGFLVDFGTKVEGVNYTIQPEDYTNASTYGSSSNTAFVMWLNTEESGIYTFKNVNNEDDLLTIKVDFNIAYNSEVDITDSFNTGINLETGIVSVRYKDGIDYIPGSYKLYVWDKDNYVNNDNKSFMLLNKYYNYEVDENTSLIDGTGKITDTNKYRVNITDIVDVDLSKLTLDLAYVEIDGVKYDFTDFFSIDSYSLDDEDETKGTIVLKTTYNIDDILLEEGTYNVVFNYTNNDLYDLEGKIERNTTVTLTKDYYEFDESEFSTNALDVTNVDYDVLSYKESEDKVVIRVGERTIELTISEFNKKYTGINLSDLVVDEDGNILYEYNDSITIKNKTVEEEVEYINYYDSDNTLQQITTEDFITTYGDLDTTNYKFEDEKIYKVVSGTYSDYSNTNTTLRYSDKGRFVFTYDYGTMNSTLFDEMSIKLKHVSNANYNAEDFIIFDEGYKLTRLTSGDEYKKVTGYEHTAFSNTVDALAQLAFDDSYDIDTTNHLITFYIEYSGNDYRYSGPYDFTMSLIDGSSITSRFVLEDSSTDYYVATYVDKHEGSDTLTSKYPPSNKKYEYYISLRMIKGNVDPSYHFYPDNIETKIYTKRADLNNQGDVYFYDQVDYIVQILNYKDNKVTYKYTTDVDKAEADRTYINKEETLDGSSDFETKFKEAYDLLNKYNYDENGDILTNSDNYDKSISRRYQNDNTEYLTYNDGSDDQNVRLSEYVTSGGNLDTLLIAYKNFEYDSDGYVKVGYIKGSYVDNTYTYNNSYDVTSLFDITVNDDDTDIDHAIKVLPKTEVLPGTYYVYVKYNDILYGVGYVNNTTANNGIYSSIDDVVVNPSKYPYLWNRNIHMSYLTYDEPIYTITVSDGLYSNTADDLQTIYYNYASSIKYKVTPQDIYDYRNITYTLEVQNEGNWGPVNSNLYSTELLDEDDNEIDDISTYNSSYYLVLNTVDNIPSGLYRLKVEYTNPINSLSLNEEVILPIDLTGKFYGITVSDETDRLEFIHNNPSTKRVVLEGDSVDNYDNLEVNIYYYKDGVRYPLTNNNGEYSYTIGEETNVYFTTTSSVDENNKYLLDITNVIDVTQIGSYIIEFNYQENGGLVSSKSLYMYITQDQFRMIFDNEYPRATASELSFAVDLTTYYLDRTSLNDIDFVLYEQVNNNYVDVSSSNVNVSNRHLNRYALEEVTCEDEECNGKVRFYLNSNKIDYNATYKIVATYNDRDEDINISTFGEMYAWDISSSSVTSVRSNNEVVNGIYKDLSDGKIEVTLTDNVHTNNISWNINTTCLSTSGSECIPTNGTYSDLFAATNTTSSNKKIIITPLLNSDNKIRANSGTYALVLYYDVNDYKVVEFTINDQYETIEYNITCEYSNDSITSSINTASGVEVLNAFYTNVNGVLSITTTLEGIGYDSVSRYVINSLGNRVNEFELNRDSDFIENHITTLTYNYANGVLPAGSYKYVTEYITPLGETVKNYYEFTINNDYFDFDIVDYSSNPTTLIVNRSGSGIFTIQTKNLNYLDKDQYNNTSNGRMHTFKNNTIIYNSNNEDVTDDFTLSVRAHSDIGSSYKFDIIVSYPGNTIDADTYKLVTNYTLNSTSVEQEQEFVIGELDKYFELGEMSYVSSSPDNNIHSNYGVVFTIPYTSNTDGAKDEMIVTVMKDETIVTNKFDITITDDNITVSYDEDSEVESGDYTINVSYAGNTEFKEFSVLDNYVVATSLESETYTISSSVIYINDLLTKSTLVDNLKNLKEGYKILDKDNTDITNTVTNIGTGMKIVNPNDGTYIISVKGDVSGDGRITSADYIKIRKHIMETEFITGDVYLFAADLTGDNVITSRDYIRVKNYIMNGGQ